LPDTVPTPEDQLDDETPAPTELRSDAPPPPERTPVEDEKLSRLVENVTDALRALPHYWTSKTVIEGMIATDLFSLNSVLGGSIEIQTVETLNRIRDVWDPDKEWPEYGFERSSQSFPDVRLVRRAGNRAIDVKLGIELKGWYLLSKEKTPSFRYTASPEACAPQDLIVVVPWHLTNVISGVPQVYEPYIEQAKYAARMRNYYWEWQRGASGEEARVTAPVGELHPYMPAKAKTSDKVTKDSGNFGRLARTHGLMTDYGQALLTTQIAGIQASHWIDFFKAYTDAADLEQVEKKVTSQLKRLFRTASDERASEVIRLIRELTAALP
jgi:hypothetical protein